jgi:hypothetical protein
MLLFPSDVEIPPLTQIEQFCSFLGLCLVLLGLASLLLPRSCFVAFMSIALPFLSESFEQLREDDHD